jgi:diguanylate cyclase (GGDEF)-like protein/PAS domain S-box-containing protein
MKSTSPKSQNTPKKNGAIPPSASEEAAKSENQPTGNRTPRRSLSIDQGLKLLSVEASEARYRRLFETAKDGILILDGDTGRIIDANPFLQDMLGYSESELIGKALWEIGPVRNIAASQDAMRELQHKEYIRHEDLPLETKGGEHKQVEFVSNVYDVDGWRVIQCNIRDITARKRAEAHAQSTNNELLALVDELRWHDQEMQLLNRLNDLLQSCMTEAEAYRVISLTAGDVFPGYSGCLTILPGKDQPLEVASRWGPEGNMEPIFSLEDCWALRRGQVHEVFDLQSGLLCNHFIEPPQGGYLCLPLTVQGNTLGVLTLMQDASRQGMYPISLTQRAVTVGETIKLSLSNLRLREELRQQAIHDPLTDLFNRRYLEEALPRELYQAQRQNLPLSIVMLDLDGFKQFNDSFGHGPGDALLREFGRVLREQLRKSDISCRYGGDEFLLVLSDSSPTDTQERLERLLLGLKSLQIHYGQQVLGMIPVSAGIAQAVEHGNTTPELLRAADKALYAAKQAGGDRIVIYQSAPPL